jgi:hypothetical protein
MRLSSTSFAHSSTAVFGLAVACYAAVRLAGYDDLPGQLALPAPPIHQLVPGTGQSDSRSVREKTDLVDRLPRNPKMAAEAQTIVTRQAAAAVGFVTLSRNAQQNQPTEGAVRPEAGSRDAQQRRDDDRSGEAADPGQPDSATTDDATAGEPNTGATSDDPADTADTTDDTTVAAEEPEN